MSDHEPDDLKLRAHQLIDGMPDDCTWDEIVEAIHVCQSIERGVRDADAGRTVRIDQLRRRFGLSA